MQRMSSFYAADAPHSIDEGDQFACVLLHREDEAGRRMLASDSRVHVTHSQVRQKDVLALVSQEDVVVRREGCDRGTRVDARHVSVPVHAQDRMVRGALKGEESAFDAVSDIGKVGWLKRSAVVVAAGLDERFTETLECGCAR